MTLQQYTVADPPQGQDWSITVPGQYTWRLLGITARLTPGAGGYPILHDASGNGYNGVYSPNQFSSAIAFSQTGFVTGNNAVAGVHAQPFTLFRAPCFNVFGQSAWWVNCWVSNPHFVGGEESFWTVANESPNGDAGFKAFANGTNLRAVFGYNPDPGHGSLTDLVFDGAALLTGTHMVGFVVDNGAQQVTCYVDGAQYGTTQSAPNLLPALAANEWIGAGYTNVATETYDEYAIGVGAPGASAWSALYAARTGISGYTAQLRSMGATAIYHLDEPAVGTARDVTLVVTDGINPVLDIAPPTPASGASQYTYSWAPTTQADSTTADGATVLVALPDVTLDPGYTIGTQTLNLSNVDRWQLITLWVDQNGTGGPGDYTPPPYESTLLLP